MVDYDISKNYTVGKKISKLIITAYDYSLQLLILFSSAIFIKTAFARRKELEILLQIDVKTSKKFHYLVLFFLRYNQLHQIKNELKTILEQFNFLSPFLHLANKNFSIAPKENNEEDVYLHTLRRGYKQNSINLEPTLTKSHKLEKKTIHVQDEILLLVFLDNDNNKSDNEVLSFHQLKSKIPNHSIVKLISTKLETTLQQLEKFQNILNTTIGELTQLLYFNKNDFNINGIMCSLKNGVEPNELQKNEKKENKAGVNTPGNTKKVVEITNSNSLENYQFTIPLTSPQLENKVTTQVILDTKVIVKMDSRVEYETLADFHIPYTLQEIRDCQDYIRHYNNT